jgi:hypothetical protein
VIPSNRASVPARMRLPFAALVLGASLAACGIGEIPRENASMNDSASIDLEILAQSRIFFGHQSVGEDVLNGLRDLLAAPGSPSLTIADVRTAPLSGSAAVAASADSAAGGDSLPVQGYILHTKVGQNTKPASKCADFARVLEERKSQVDVAVLKYCYVDVGGSSDPDALFAEYQALLEGLRKKLPSVTLVPSTVPLTVGSARPDWRRKDLEVKIRRMIGLYDGQDKDNLKRGRFNDLLRQAYAGGVIFDVAKAESTHPDGRREGFSKGSKQVPSLIPAYTHDGGHLNEAGRKIVAREFVRVLAQAAKARTRTASAASMGSSALP